MIGKIDQYLSFNETALSLRAQRQELLASNIANADTPNYKARDIDFSSALQSALAGKGATGGPLATTAQNHIGRGKPSGDMLSNGTPVMYRGEVQGNVDGNTVDMDVERNQFTDNAVRYEAGLTMISHQIKNLLTAIQGQ
jgi:flagellar basal-body rod protein FlgB